MASNDPILFHSSVPFEALCRSAERDLRVYYSRLQVPNEGVTVDWFGAPWKTMLESSETTLQYLDSDNALLRFKALLLIADYWFPSQAFAARCLDIAFKDEDASVRGAALACLQTKLHICVRDETGQFSDLLAYLGQISFPIYANFATAAYEKAEERVAWVSQHIAAEIERQAGAHLQQMLSGPEEARSFLEHADGEVRAAALSVLFERWRGTFDLRATCLAMITTDADVKVRSHAQGILATLCFQTNDTEVLHLFAKAARNTAESLEVRKSAYIALFAVLNLPPERLLYASTQTFPDEADWDFVDGLLPEHTA